GDHRLLARDQAEIIGGGFDLLAVVDAFADAHIDDDLLDHRHLQAVLLAELFGELLAHDVFEIGLVPRRYPLLRPPPPVRARCLRPFRPCRLSRACGPFAPAAPCRPSRAAQPCRLPAASRPWLWFRCQPSISTPERLATRTLRRLSPSPTNLKPMRVGFPSL